jgi:hypothetical protein
MTESIRTLHALAPDLNEDSSMFIRVFRALWDGNSWQSGPFKVGTII